ncbi:hypothetical protein RHGRI_028242 [Rhododendron griersonianum]|uniref:Uncharacterized protein n=1 Tax=Rhododendron griersonianum TaxID=479676 RepID=A0AAV6IIC2_9ERIC|nr:hypothetical protein RHGRI_028242 [Rhododendron griersonianum]
MRPGHTMKQHLRAMSSMIHELKVAGNNLSDEQQVQAVIRSLPSTTVWDNMSQNLTHNENLKTFDDVERHLVLEAERQEAAKPISSANMVESSSRQASRLKRNCHYMLNAILLTIPYMSILFRDTLFAEDPRLRFEWDPIPENLKQNRRKKSEEISGGKGMDTKH